MLLQDWQNFLFKKQVARSYVRARIWAVLILFILICSGLGFYHAFKPMRDNLDYQSQPYIVNASDINFLTDLTYTNANGQRQVDQHIFDTAFKYIDGAEQYILVDMFLFNDMLGKNDQAYRGLSGELVAKLLAKKQNNPDIRIDVIVDPINTVYGGYDSPQLKKLSAAGVNVIVADLSPLRDDNPVYSAAWRLLIGWWGNSYHGWLPNPFAYKGQRVTLRSYLAIPNFKADHRKAFLVDSQGELISIIGSANVHDASSAHSNTAVAIRGVFGQEVYKAEEAVALMSHNSLQPLPQNLLAPKTGANDYAKVSLVTEARIRAEVLSLLNGLQTGDQLQMSMFYVADRPIVNALVGAAKRGAVIKIILDPSKDAFGYKKMGIPNRPVAAELLNRSDQKIDIRWYQTQGEQFHTKMMLVIKQVDQTASLLIGSANLTKRNVGNYNLENDVLIETKTGLGAAGEAEKYFNKLWANEGGATYTVDYSVYANGSWLITSLYWLQEVTGLSSF